jgi:hypothetical protein
MAHTVNEMLNGSAQNRLQKFMTDVNVVRLHLFHPSWAVAYKFYSQQIKLPTEADSECGGRVRLEGSLDKGGVVHAYACSTPYLARDGARSQDS